MKHIYLCFLCMFAGCAVAPMTATRLDETAIKEPSEGKGIFIFYRVVSNPAAYPMRVILDGTQIVSLPNESFSWIELDAGRHDLKIDYSNWSGMPSQKAEIEIEAGARHYLKLDSNLGIGGGPAIDLIVHWAYGVEDQENEAEAQRHERQILKCCRYVPSSATQ